MNRRKENDGMRGNEEIEEYESIDDSNM